jgi:DNA polymerase theta
MLIVNFVCVVFCQYCSKIQLFERMSRSFLKGRADLQGGRIDLAPGKAAISTRIQLIAMSATVGNVHQLARWFGCDSAYVTDFRPIALFEKIAAGTELFNKKGQKMCNLAINNIQGAQSNSSGIPSAANIEDSLLAYLCDEATAKGQQVLLFMPTKQGCVVTCSMLAKVVEMRATPSSLQQQQRDLKAAPSSHSGQAGSSSTGADSDKIKIGRLKAAEDLRGCNKAGDKKLYSSVLVGVGYHHSGLTMEERAIIEAAFRDGLLSVLVATSTLAAGVNLPAGRVLIRSMKLGAEDLDVVHYRQMVRQWWTVYHALLPILLYAHRISLR